MKMTKNQSFVLCGLLCAAMAQAQEVERTAGGVKNYVHTQEVTQEICFYSDDIVRVVKYPGKQKPEKKSYPVILTPEDVKVTYAEQGDRLSMKTANLEVVMD